jgi:hypothetical protein
MCIMNGYLTLTSQKAKTQYITALVVSIGLCSSVKTYNNDAYLFFTELFKDHPAYAHGKCTGLVDLRIEYSKFKHLMIVMVFDDGRTDGISYNLCVTKKPLTDKHKLRQVMRYHIMPQIYEFRNANYKVTKCNTIDCQYTTSLQVDHIIWFEKLAQDFIGSTSHVLPIKFNYDKSIMPPDNVFLESDSEFRDDWITYHQEHAQLQFLCATCNTKRTKYKCPQY